jgi:hypothetical protein
MGETLEKTQEIATRLDALLDASKAIHSLDPFWLEHARKCIAAVYGPLAPFRDGDRVTLSEPPLINNETAPGWMHCRHFLVRGAVGTVADVRYDDDGYAVAVAFDDETWIPSVGELAGKPQPVRRKGLFWMKAERFVRATRSPGEGETP